MHDEMTTWEAYRYAERTFKWKVCRFYRFVWIVAVSYLFLAMTFPVTIGSAFVGLAMVAAIASAIAHSGSQNLTMPGSR